MSNRDEPRFGRLITAMVTPFNDERELDPDRAQALATRLIEGGNDSLIINGTTGESPTVFYPQKIELFRAVVEAVGGKASERIANVGDNCTADTVNFAKDVAKLGVGRLHVRRPVLQQASARGNVPALQDHCECGGAPHHPRQHRRAAALSTWKLRPRCASPTIARTSSP